MFTIDSFEPPVGSDGFVQSSYALGKSRVGSNPADVVIEKLPRRSDRVVKVVHSNHAGSFFCSFFFFFPLFSFVSIIYLSDGIVPSWVVVDRPSVTVSITLLYPLLWSCCTGHLRFLHATMC